MRDYFKFPSTPHICMPRGADIREDKVMSVEDIGEMLRHKVVIEEKVDGANLGISFDEDGNLCLQNRGNLLQNPLSGQWKYLRTWIEARKDRLFDVLLDQYILFGEWCFATHSIYYNNLPDYFIGFDLYDKKASKFLSVDLRNKLLNDMGIYIICSYAEGFFQLRDLYSMFSQSHYGDEICEGLYIRWDDAGWLKKRAKLVRHDFMQKMDEHWMKGTLKKNLLLEFHLRDG